MRFAFTLLLLLLTSLVALADNYANGYVSPAGYVFNNGFWHRGGNAYTRQLVTTPACYVNGCYQQASSYYQYTHAPSYTPPAVTVNNYVKPSDPDWRTKLLEVAAARDKQEAKYKQQQIEHQQYMEAVAALGLPNRGYGGGYGNLQLSSAGVQGTTIYGYSYNALAQSLYGDNNLSQLYQDAFRLADRAGQSAQLATAGHAQLAGQAGQHQAKVAEILAKAEVLKALNQPSFHQEKREFNFGPKPVIPTPAPPVGEAPTPAAADSRIKWEASARAKCLSCHFGDKKQGGFDVTQYAAMTPEQKQAVIRRFYEAPPKRMPKDGPPLTPEEIQLWLSN